MEALASEPESLMTLLIHVAITGIVLLVCGLAAALKVAIHELDGTHLAVLRESGDARTQAKVTRAQAVLEQHHLIVLSLVLIHAAMDEALPVLLSYLLPNEYAAIAVAIPLVLIFYPPSLSAAGGWT